MIQKLNNLLLFISFLTVIFTFAACGDEDKVCESSDIQDCECDGKTGKQICNDDGSGWQTCVCTGNNNANPNNTNINNENANIATNNNNIANSTTGNQNNSAVCEPEEEVCDGVDNDCNDEIDDGELCNAGERCDDGECVLQCKSTTEICDGVDNDCDSEVDEGDLCDLEQLCENGQCVSCCDPNITNCDHTNFICEPEEVLEADLDLTPLTANTMNIVDGSTGVGTYITFILTNSGNIVSTQITTSLSNTTKHPHKNNFTFYI